MASSSHASEYAGQSHQRNKYPLQGVGRTKVIIILFLLNRNEKQNAFSCLLQQGCSRVRVYSVSRPQTQVYSRLAGLNKAHTRDFSPYHIREFCTGFKSVLTQTACSPCNFLSLVCFESNGINNIPDFVTKTVPLLKCHSRLPSSGQG